MSTNPEASSVFSKLSAPVVGFGLYRNGTDNPWFTAQEYAKAVPESSFKKFLLPSPSGFTNIRKLLTEQGFMETEQIPRRNGRPSIAMHVLKAAEEPFVDYLLQKTTNAGLSVPEMLLVPESVDYILDTTDFLQRLFTQVSGRASTVSYDSRTE
jgi:hypothetical protein